MCDKYVPTHHSSLRSNVALDAAGHVHGGAGDVAGLRRGEKYDRRRHFLGPAEAFERDVAAGSAARTGWTMLKNFRSSSARHTSSGVSRKVAKRPPPALHTSTSTPPNSLA